MPVSTKNKAGKFIPAFAILFVFQLFLTAVGTDNVGVFQLTDQVCFYRIDIDPTKLIPLLKLFGGQTFGFCFLCQFVDSGDDFIHFHSYLTHTGE